MEITIIIIIGRFALIPRVDVTGVCASVFDQSITESFYRGLLQIKWEVEVGGRLMTAFPLLLLRPYLLNGMYL